MRSEENPLIEYFDERVELNDVDYDSIELLLTKVELSHDDSPTPGGILSESSFGFG